jgi:hypothetical protein
MPPPKRLAFYGGLGALVVTGLVDLPVAVAIGAAAIVARSGGEERAKEASAKEASAAPQSEQRAGQKTGEQRERAKLSAPPLGAGG